jgi:hypothetical protein
VTLRSVRVSTGSVSNDHGCTTAFKVVGRFCHHVPWMASRFIPTTLRPLDKTNKLT